MFLYNISVVNVIKLKVTVGGCRSQFATFEIFRSNSSYHQVQMLPKLAGFDRGSDGGAILGSAMLP